MSFVSTVHRGDACDLWYFQRENRYFAFTPTFSTLTSTSRSLRNKYALHIAVFAASIEGAGHLNSRERLKSGIQPGAVPALWCKVRRAGTLLLCRVNASQSGM